jgi:hypothetical protein
MIVREKAFISNTFLKGCPKRTKTLCYEEIKHIALFHTIIFEASEFQGSNFKLQKIESPGAISFFFFYKKVSFNFCAS